MPSQLARFTDRIVDLSQKAVGGDPDLAVKKGDGDYADWVIVAVHCLESTLIRPTDDCSNFTVVAIVRRSAEYSPDLRTLHRAYALLNCCDAVRKAAAQTNQQPLLSRHRTQSWQPAI
jgi:hypothetical protein